MRRAALLVCLGLVACQAEARAPKSEPISASVVVTDGDTLKIRGERIRIANIDAPELPPGSRCWAEAALSLQSAEALEGIIARAKSLDVQREGKDRYGRTLARLTFNGRDVGEALINRGLAARWTGRRWDWCGAPRFEDVNGPAMIAGPEENQSYTDWLAKQTLRNVSASGHDPWAVREVSPGPGATQAR